MNPTSISVNSNYTWQPHHPEELEEGLWRQTALQLVRTVHSLWDHL
jgi:hypothetical protein